MPAGSVADVAKGVKSAVREIDNRTGPNFGPSIIREDAVSTFDDDEKLVLGDLPMRRWPASRWYD